MNHSLGIDVWEGNPNLDENTLAAAGVEFMIIRLNDMNGGHHMDTHFNSQWDQSASFVRIPYFVYNPWVSGTENYNWMMGHLPANVTAVMVDEEVVKSGYSASEYGNQLRIFRQLIGTQLKFMNYTGAWFLPNVDPWPVDQEYWWARYPYVLYPSQCQTITWDQLKAILATLNWWAPGTGIPGPCRLWQCTADRYILPGCGGVCVDVNVWNGSIDELRTWMGTPAPSDWAHALTAWAHGLGYTGPDPES